MYKNLRKEVKILSERETGVVKWFNGTKGYGFIQRDSGGDIFIHYSAIITEGFKSLEEGQRVEFSVTETDRGLQAQEVSAI